MNNELVYRQLYVELYLCIFVYIISSNYIFIEIGKMCKQMQFTTR